MDIEYNFPSAFDEHYGLLTRKLVRMLSEDSRISILELSRKFGVSRRTIRERMQRMQKDIGYTIEFNEREIGLTSPHLITLKFKKKPDYEEITRMLSESHIPQLAVTVKGRYDMLIYANATTSDDYVHWDKSLQIKLSKYGLHWHSSDVAHKQLGYFPIRNELIDQLDIEQVHKDMLKHLNWNARTTFSEMSKKMNMHFNTVAYNFNKLLKKKYISRFTISMARPPNLVLMSMFSKYVLENGYEEDSARARRAYMESGTEFPFLNRYQICAQLVGSYDFFSMGIFDDYDTAYLHQIRNTKEIFRKHNARLEYGTVEKVLLGRLPLRSVDAKKEYNVMKWT